MQKRLKSASNGGESSFQTVAKVGACLAALQLTLLQGGGAYPGISLQNAFGKRQRAQLLFQFVMNSLPEPSSCLDNRQLWVLLFLVKQR